MMTLLPSPANSHQEPLYHVARRVLVKAIHAYRRRRAANELRRLDDRMLADLGIERGDIDSVVSGIDHAPLKNSIMARRSNVRSTASANDNGVAGTDSRVA